MKKEKYTLLDDVYKRYKRETNMTFSQLKKWEKNPTSKMASLSNKPIKNNLLLLATPKSKWKMKHIKLAIKSISFLRRMKKIKAGKKIKDVGFSKKTIALKNWAYDPNK